MRTTNPAMSAYERQAWELLLDDVSAPAERSRPLINSKFLGAAKNKAKDVTSAVGTKSKELFDAIPNSDVAAEKVNLAFERAMDGLPTSAMDFGLKSVNTAKVVDTLYRHGGDIRNFDGVRNLDLRICDRASSNSRQVYVIGGLAEGVASSLVVTGFTMGSAVTGGASAAAAVGVIAVDSATVLVGMGRIVASIAAYYGYDVKEPDEAAYAAGVLSYAAASGPAEKDVALAALSRLTKQMMRKNKWKKMPNNVAVRVIQTVFKSLGLRLTKRKLAQTVPIAGLLIGGGLNAKLAMETYNRALTAYRLRFLTEKYNLDPNAWAPAGARSTASDKESLPLIDEIIDAEIVED